MCEREFAGKLGYLVIKMQKKKAQSAGPKVLGSGGTKKPIKKKDKSLHALAVSMLRFAVVCVVCIVLYVVTVLLLLPEMRENAHDMAS